MTSEQENNVGNEFQKAVLHIVFCQKEEKYYKMAMAPIFDLCMNKTSK